MRTRSLMSKHVAVALAVITALCAATVVVGRTPIFVVNSADDDRDDRCNRGHCNLREAIRAANESSGAVIRFDLPAYPFRIELKSALPALRDHVVLDGATQAGAECPMPVVHIDGSKIAAKQPVNGLEVFGDFNDVRGLVITNFSGHGVVVNGAQNSLRCLFVGVGPTGTQPRGNAGHGIAVIGGHSNRIGGTAFEDANLLSDNGGYGLYIEDALDTFRGRNGMGLDILGNPKLPNGDAALAINPPAPASMLDQKTERELTGMLERRIRLILSAHARAIATAGLYEKYLPLIAPDPTGAKRPADLSELIVVLARDPVLYATFTQDASAVLAGARAAAALELAELTLTFRATLPAFGRDAAEPTLDQRDVLSETLASLAARDYVVSRPPSGVVAALADPLPIGFPPLRWHSLTTYGPQNFNAEIGNLPSIHTCVGTLVPCVWPVAYDLLPFSAQLLWESSTFTQQELADIVQENGYFLRLRVNGQLLYGGPPFGSPGIDPLVAQLQGYFAATVPASPCPAGRRCIATNVLVRKKLWNVPLPWTFELEVMALSPLGFPIPGGIDENGNPILITHQAQTIATASRVVQPNSTSSKRWFTEALLPTFHHPRCADCHGFGTFEALAVHHGLSLSGLINDTGVHLEPSAYVPGAHVMVCVNCHYVPHVDNHGHPFHETEWIAPYQDLDVNWAQKNSAQICTRVKANLPTKELRHEHFHGDGRLFWAIENPVIMGWTMSPAPPNDFDEFLRRIDLWNYLGAPCP